MHLLTLLAKQRAVLLETRKRDGSWVGTPVNVAVADGHVYFRTWNVSGKAKRLRNFPGEVRLAPCTMLGKPTGEAVTGAARLLDDGEADTARASLAAKYPVLQGRFVPAYHRLRGWKTLHYEWEPR
jgi:PPOX class probable F420-dependent enzyme